MTGWRRAVRDGILPLDGEQVDRTDDAPAFVPLEIAETPAPETGAGTSEQCIEIVAQGVKVRLPADTDVPHIAAVAAELAARR